MKTIAYKIAFLIGLMGYYLMPVDATCRQSDCPCSSFCLDSENRWCNDNSNADCECKKGCMHYDGFLLPGENENIHCNICRCSSNPTNGGAACNRNAVCGVENLREGVDFPFVHDIKECDPSY
ncbi:hypothetical protein CHS0354_003954 [Potamilus streckersoni]|uniref:Uncharacterized protein n=1 Tax=Potamilus streckersoni TaxID=2493646 RepID=A0AAE0W7T8_9BIVA|nr:hypothetical protein CHS0354_003954 [Potamilus streckersoni]